ncbi:hypothetical protein [Salmonella phage SD-1_S14]|nr:hypothetical protein [Salmonella phage SD-2_S15]WPK19153.1 hypothetical protein [Salmonella phage SD-6_S16]WPK19826.1 hypothetical protein [Salmonella phage SD-1_S14]WPK20850.1 hypothetical protein [Salmonella phage SD-15_S21]
MFYIRTGNEISNFPLSSPGVRHTKNSPDKIV